MTYAILSFVPEIPGLFVLFVTTTAEGVRVSLFA